MEYADIDNDATATQLFDEVSNTGKNVTELIAKTPGQSVISSNNIMPGLIVAGNADKITSDNYSGG